MSGKILLIFLSAGLVAMLWSWRGGGELTGWSEDYAAARAEAGSAGKPLLLYFTADWCGPCQQMRRTTWADSTVRGKLDQFVYVKIDIDAHRDLAARFMVDAIPRLVVLNDAEQPLATHTGYLSPAEMTEWLSRAGRAFSSMQ